jgi:SPP1 family predicted phage head-tail adaptor
MAAGEFNYRVAFDAPVTLPDGSGGTENGWSEAFQAYAAFMFLRGGETVQAARLTGRQPVVVTIYNTAEARQVTTDWRMRDTRAGTVYNVRTVIPSDDRAHLELTCESGVAP